MLHGVAVAQYDRFYHFVSSCFGDRLSHPFAPPSSFMKKNYMVSVGVGIFEAGIGCVVHSTYYKSGVLAGAVHEMYCGSNEVLFGTTVYQN